jgi:protein-S-isoprenylcysteine O-methyltransferase Ste14
VSQKSDGAPDDDHAGVAFRPPVLLGAVLITVFALKRLFHPHVVSQSIALSAGPAVTILAVAFAVWAVITMKRGGSSVPTHLPTDAIVRRGPYRLSRNPIYVSMIGLLLGVGIWSDNVWFLPLVIVFAGLLQWGVISREENYLERKFGDEYASYKSKVRRWL